MANQDQHGELRGAGPIRLSDDDHAPVTIQPHRFSSQLGMDDDAEAIGSAADARPGESSRQFSLDGKGSDVNVEELELATFTRGTERSKWYVPDMDSDQSGMAIEKADGPRGLLGDGSVRLMEAPDAQPPGTATSPSPFMMENGELMRRGIVSPRDPASGLPTGIAGDDTGTSAPGWPDATVSMLNNKNPELTRNAPETSQAAAGQGEDGPGGAPGQGDQPPGIIAILIGAKSPDQPAESSLLNNKNPELTRYDGSYIGETEKNLDVMDHEGPSTLLGTFNADAQDAAGDVDGTDFLIWRHGVAAGDTNSDAPVDIVTELDEPGEVDLDI